MGDHQYHHQYVNNTLNGNYLGKSHQLKSKTHSQVPLSTQIGRELRKLMISPRAGWSPASLSLPQLSMSAAMELCSPVRDPPTLPFLSTPPVCGSQGCIRANVSCEGETGPGGTFAWNFLVKVFIHVPLGIFFSLLLVLLLIFKS